MPPAPPLVRDPWAWASVLAVLPLAAKMLGAPLAEPVAEDFDFLHRALLEGMGTLLDGGGSQAFWRPIPHQLYYAVLGRVLVAAPAVVGLLHLALLALGALLLYRALRPTWAGGLAAAAASFPLLAESTRTIAGWPTQFVDLGLFLFTALALHEATRRRLPTALAALLAALLCKEVAVVSAVLLPFVPAGPRGRAERVRWGLAVALLLAAWGAAYLAVRHAAHLALPHGIEHDPAVLATPPLARYGWALVGSLRAIVSLALVRGPHDALAFAAAAALALATLGALATSAAARARLVRAWPWAVFGLAWFLLATGTLATIFPLWQPNRSQYGSVGLGLAAAALLGAAHPLVVYLLVLTRLALLGVSAAPATAVGVLPPETGAFMDYARLTRLQRFMRATRTALVARRPALPAGAVVLQQNLPHALEYALGGDHALQVWYRDPSLHWGHFDAFRADPSRPVAAIVQYQPGQHPEVAIVEPEAARLQLVALQQLRERRFDDVLATLARADAIQRDTAAVVFRMTSDTWRSFVRTSQGRPDEGEAIARRALAWDRTDTNLRYVLALALTEARRLDAAQAELDTLLALAPADVDVLALRDRLVRERSSDRRSEAR